MPNLLQTVPFLSIADMPRSLAFYVDGLGFAIQHKWEPEGQIRWVWLARGQPPDPAGQLRRVRYGRRQSERD